MRPAAHGRPGTGVIPTGWAAAHRPTLAATHTVTIAWRAPGGTVGAFDPATLDKTVTPAVAYATTLARVQVLSPQGQDVLVAEDDVTVVGYQVTVDVGTTDYKVGHIGKVTAVDDNADPTLAGKSLRIESVARGSHVFERVLICVETLD